MDENNVTYRIIIQKSVNGIDSNSTKTVSIFSQDFDGDLDVRGIIAAVNNLVKPEEIKKA